MDFVTADRIDPEALLEGANDAFSDYVIPTPVMPMAAWQEMLRQRGFAPGLSWLAVEDGAVEAYWLVGTADAARPGASYGISVGTRPRARRQGLSSALWTRAFKRLRDGGYRTHVLEVIEINTRAVPLYEGLGFHAARRLECIKGTAPAPREIGGISFQDVPIDEAERVGQTLREWEPTWQNATPAVHNLAESMVATIATENENPVAFGYFHKPYGQVVQIAVAPSHRQRGIASTLVSHWARQTERDILSTLNIPDTDESSRGFFRTLGWENHVNQFEMAIAL